jgi:hypothetical protein
MKSFRPQGKNYTLPKERLFHNKQYIIYCKNIVSLIRISHVKGRDLSE